MTPDDLSKILDAATPGPWSAHGTICCPDRGWVTTQEVGHKQPTHAFSIADAEMVATMRNLAPALLRLWRAAKTHSVGDHFNECYSDNGCVCGKDDIDAALRELEAHKP